MDELKVTEEGFLVKKTDEFSVDSTAEFEKLKSTLENPYDFATYNREKGSLETWLIVEQPAEPNTPPETHEDIFMRVTESVENLIKKLKIW